MLFFDLILFLILGTQFLTFYWDASQSFAKVERTTEAFGLDEYSKGFCALDPSDQSEFDLKNPVM